MKATRPLDLLRKRIERVLRFFAGVCPSGRPRERQREQHNRNPEHERNNRNAEKIHADPW
jgi:hypothetical protein